MNRTRVDLFALANVGPSALTIWGASPVLVGLVFCGGNVLWLTEVLRRGQRVSTRDVLAATLILTVAGLTWARLLERPGTINGGLAWDGRQYIAIYWHFKRGAYWPLVPEFPYFQRIGLPLLGAVLPLNPSAAFVVLHIAFWIGTMILFARTCRDAFGLGAATTLLGVLWLQVLWLSVPRGVIAYQFTVDPAVLFFLQAWIYVLLTGKRLWLLPLLAFTGTFFKETMLLVVALSIPGAVMFFGRTRAIVLSAAAAALAKALAAHALGLHVTGSVVETIRHWYVIRTAYPEMELTRYVAAMFGAYGGFLLLWCVTLDRPRGTWPRTDRFALVLAALYLPVCFVSGTDLTRFAYMAFPFLFPVLLRAFEDVHPAYGLAALALGLPAAHVFTAIPAPAPGQADMPNRDLTGLYSWAMEYAHFAVVGTWMAWWLGCALVLRTIGCTQEWRSGVIRKSGLAVPSGTTDDMNT